MHTVVNTQTPAPLFNFGDHAIRANVDAKGNPWFVAADVCAALDIKNTSDAVAKLDDDEKGVVITDTLGGKQTIATVNESGLYELIFRSRKKEAQEFKRLVKRVVLPTLRKDGVYIVGEEKLSFDGMRSNEIQTRIDQLQKAIALAVEAKVIRARLEHEEEKDARREAFQLLSRGRSRKHRSPRNTTRKPSYRFE